MSRHETAALARPLPGAPAAPRGRTPAAVRNALVWSAVAGAAIAVAILAGLDGWTYYTTPASVRGYLPAHRLLRPSGQIGQPLGIAGFVLMTFPVIYAMRKRIVRLRQAGSLAVWLEAHVFCGIVGPVLISFHTSFKFNGIVSVAYWSMVLVAASGFVGRYLYVRLPRSLRGHELSRTEIEARAAALSAAIAAARLPERVLAHIERFERRMAPPDARHASWLGLLSGDWQMRRELRQIQREIDAAGASALHHEAIALVAERTLLLRRVAYLKKTKALFDLWHVFHLPLVYAMFAIVVMHVAFTVYMGYVPFAD